MLGSCINVLGVMHLCVDLHVFMCWRSKFDVLGVMHLCVTCQHIYVLAPINRVM